MKWFFAIFFVVFIQLILPKEQLAQVSESVPFKGPPELDAILLECPKFKDPRPCETQLLVNIRVSPSSNVEAADKFFILDEVYDPLKRIKVKIVSPYLIEVSRGEPVIMYPLQFKKTINVNKNNNNRMNQTKKSKVVGRNIRTNMNKKAHDNWEDYSKKPFTREKSNDPGEVHLKPSKKVQMEIELKQRLQELKNRNVRSNIEITKNVPLYDSSKSNRFNYNFNKIANQGKTSQYHSRGSESYNNLARLGLVQYVTQPPVSSNMTSDSTDIYNETSTDIITFALDDKTWPKIDNDKDDNDNPVSIEVSATLSSVLENKSLPLQPNPTLMSFGNSGQLRILKNIGENETLAYPALNSSKGLETISSDIKNEMDRLRRKYPFQYSTNTDFDVLKFDGKALKLKNYFPQEQKQPDFNFKLPSYELDGQVPFENEPLRKNFKHLDDTDFKLLTKSWPKKYPSESYNENRLTRNRYNAKLAKEYNKNLQDIVYNYNPGEFVIQANRLHELSHKIPENEKFRGYDRDNFQKNYGSQYENPFMHKYHPDNSSVFINVPFKSYKHSLKRRSIAAYSPLSIHNVNSKISSSYKKPTDFPESLNIESKKHIRNSKQKRSYYMYDDLDFQDSGKESDVDANNLPMNILPDNSEITKSDDIESCNSCGGKNKKPPPRKPECSNQKCASNMPENVRDGTEDASCDSYGGKNKKPPLEKPGCFNQKCSNNLPENVRDETEDASCDSCGGKNKKPPPPEKPGSFLQNGVNVLSNIPDETEDASCDSCGGKNKKPPPPEKSGCFMQNCANNKAIAENIRVEADDASCDSCGGKNKKPPNKKPGCLFQNVPDETEDDSCDSCDGKNKKPTPEKHGCRLENDDNIDVEETLSNTYGDKNKKPQPEKLKYSDDILDMPEESPCDSCGGKNNKPAPKKSGWFFKSNANAAPMPENVREEYIDVPCNSCGRYRKPGSKPVRDSFGNICNCINDPASCRCASLKNARSVNETYSVFNMSVPLPFLTTKIRIYRKRQNAWWRIIPEVTLNSLSGIFTNANLSVLFSSHVDILQLEKSLCFQKQTLLVPSKGKSSLGSDTDSQTSLPLNTDPHKIFAFNSYATDISKLDEVDSTFFQEQAINEDFEVWDEKQYQFSRPRKHDPPKIGITPLSDLGYFPTSMNLLEQCPNDKNRLCLNMLDDQVPAFTIKLKMPFRENSIIKPSILKVKISRIVTDATTKDALQISIDVINKGFQTHEFYISVSECPFSCVSSTKSTVRKVLMPYIGETVTFLLPLITKPKDKHKKIKCDVIVKSLPVLEPKEQEVSNNCPSSSKKRSDESNLIIVARREMEVETQARCFCVWKCKCHCIPKLENYVNFDVCQKMSYNCEKESGLLLNCPSVDQTEDVCLMDAYNNEDSMNSENLSSMLRKLLNILIILLLLGLLKALLGLCSEKINRFCYGWVQPFRTYDCSSKSRRFIVNFLFFVMLPCRFCCKCFAPSLEDLMIADTEWECKGTCEQNLSHDTDYDGDEAIFTNTKVNERRKTRKRRSHSKRNSRLSGGGSDSASSSTNYQSSRPSQKEANVDNQDSGTEEDADSSFVIWESLTKSKVALETLIQKTCCSRFPELEYSKSLDFVNNLKAAGVVYRIFDQPLENIQKIPPNFKYCIQGFFISIDGIYQFMNTIPLVQYICVAEDGQTTELLKPVAFLNHDCFNRDYRNQEEVLEANDLSIMQPYDVPCINVMTVNTAASALIKLEQYQYRISDAVALPTFTENAITESKELIKHNVDLIQEIEDPIIKNPDVIKEHEDQIKGSQDQIKVSEEQIKGSQDQIKVSEDQIKESEDQIKLSEDPIKENENGSIEEKRSETQQE